MSINIRRVYLYLTSLIGLILVLIGAVQLINLGLKTWVFTKADEQFYGPCYERSVAPVKDGEQPKELNTEECDKQKSEGRSSRRQADAARSIAFILVGAPVWFYHWNKVKDERSE